MFAKTLCFLGFAAVTIRADIADELVTSLPGIVDTVPFKMYSGYAEVTATKKLHYVLAESKDDPANDPLVIWYNGGPGCSSMMGLFQEHGPYVVEDGETNFHENIWSWNNHANMLYIEMPGGVGFSTCDASAGECAFTDESTGADNMVALKNWFKKFTHYQNHDLYVSGESYGGVYVPFVVRNIMTHNANLAAGETAFNLKGFMIGNGVTNWKYDTTPAFVKMGFWHGLTDYDHFLALKKNDCDFSIFGHPSEECMALFNQFQQWTASVNPYDVYRKCWTIGGGMQMYSGDNFGIAKVGGQMKAYKKYYTAADYTPWIYSQDHSEAQKMVQELPPCVYGSTLVDTLNGYDMRTALHIPDDVQAWSYCTSRDNGWSYQSGDEASYNIWKDLRHSGLRAMFYSGDTDGSVPTLGTLTWINSLEWEKTREWTPYHYDGQVAGYTQEHEMLTFASIHGVGHMAPQWKRPETHEAIFTWLNGKKLF